MKFGVYRIRHLDSNRCYIGSSATGLASRWSQHRSALKKQTHDSPYVQNAWNKYGAHAFVFEVLLYCDPENCLMYEQIALDHYQPVYNIRKVAASNMGIIPSQQTRDRISQTLKTTYARDGHPLAAARHRADGPTLVWPPYAPHLAALVPCGIAANRRCLPCHT